MNTFFSDAPSEYIRSSLEATSQKAIGARIKTARKSKGLSQTQLANTLNISTSFMCCIESGHRRFSSHIAADLVNALDITYEYLITGAAPANIPFISAVCEASVYSERLRLERLIENCTKAEYDMCFQLCKAYLETSRKKAFSAVNVSAELFDPIFSD